MKHCETCRKPIPKRSRDSTAVYLARRFCSNACRGQRDKLVHKPKDAIERHCERCGKVRPRRENEHEGAYQKKRFCSHRCAIEARKDLEFASRRQRKAAQALKIPAATEAEWLRLNGGPTVCPTMYAAPIEHYAHVPARSGRR